MRKFIINIAIFISPFLLLCIPIDIYLSQKVENTSECSGEFEVWTDIYSSKINCELAIYGSSRAWVHINPEILKDSLKFNAYNFGIDGHNFWLQYLRHIEYQKSNSKPQIIIHSIDIFTLQKKKELYNMSQFLPYMLWNLDIYKSTTSYEGYSAVDYFIPLIRYRHNTTLVSSLMTSLNQQNQPYRNKGFKGQQIEWNNDLDNAQKSNTCYSINLDSSSITLYEHFLEDCKSKNIEVILVYTPEYIDGQKYVSNRKEIIDFYKAIATKYKLLFLDYSNNYLCFDKKFFYNAEHLNAIGADIFTRILASDLKKARTHNIVYTQWRAL